MLLAKKLAAWLAVALFAAATAVALLQPVHPDPFRTSAGFYGEILGGFRKPTSDPEPASPESLRQSTAWHSLLYPSETNAFRRLPSTVARLNDLDVQIDEDGRTKLWAVGHGGAILHSSDGGRCWEAREIGLRKALKRSAGREIFGIRWS